ncbi:FAD-binding oxidoreductase [Waterburya agarophytonicola K14]|uniref:FAD-binding oxidoreductase n=1 Tax=Waterburya agarophytonicola KI4 TaxID=2874699 RepID=A0A964BRN9_9CYAN|nr:FAD-binding oxidoreductase [Waterburya agarophytonicola]MCC0178369.1 FAD-binding oxidoreductase [Waterburya agarophytonicola KI4]
MTIAIATAIKSIIDSKTELVELAQADVPWQTKISQAVIKSSQPIYLVFPQSVDILAAIVKQASQEQWRILICGNGTKLNWGNSARDIQLVISTQKCDRLIEHAVGDLTVTAEAGMKLKDLQVILRWHNQFLPIDPSYPDTATLGGIVATADTGSWRERYGGIRDLLLGISLVRADGAIAKAGGRVVKNVAGYDLMKLFTGAYGTLGIISQLTFRTFPIIATSQTVLLTGTVDSIATATKTIRNSGLTPTAMDLLSNNVIDRLELEGNVGLIARWQTIPESIQQQIEQVKATAIELNLATNTYQEQGEIDLWQKCTTITSVSNSEQAVICKIGISPTAAVNFLQLKEIIDNKIAIRIHASSGIGQLQLNNPDRQIINQMRSHCQANHGFLTILNASETTKQELDIWGYQGNAIKTMQAIKNQFDPQHILNPNRFIV